MHKHIDTDFPYIWLLNSYPKSYECILSSCYFFFEESVRIQFDMLLVTWSNPIRLIKTWKCVTNTQISRLLRDMNKHVEKLNIFSRFQRLKISWKLSIKNLYNIKNPLNKIFYNVGNFLFTKLFTVISKILLQHCSNTVEN